ncbi:hypothetical protein [Thermoflexibacter ruber]|uniref:Uncharacterized protein n=1 Tax=Thermoflexibacter ruber TaxID=1003 RepID=A0A1I2BK16_9BACT|nr:hypothetical protein [Thermoflexibacter ruber]SFE56505.1 hypothetical protein SAMN04488541_100348 [Thermoflexibacter ruber]
MSNHRKILILKYLNNRLLYACAFRAYIGGFGYGQGMPRMRLTATTTTNVVKSYWCDVSSGSNKKMIGF